ncbi:MAG: hypothetical protein QOJ09_1905, partial [Actinomycetota bacterium]|nr:hypothetical protein [Actinomycetota bacterium]
MIVDRDLVGRFRGEVADRLAARQRDDKEVGRERLALSDQRRFCRQAANDLL